MAYDPNILALLMPQLMQGQGGGMGQAQRTQSGGGQKSQQANSQMQQQGMLALLASAGLIPRHYDTSGQLLAPGQVQGGSGLDGATFKGLDSLHAMQQGRSPQYSSPSFPTQGMPSRVSQAPTASGYVPTQGLNPSSLLPPPRTTMQVSGLQPTAQEMLPGQIPQAPRAKIAPSPPMFSPQQQADMSWIQGESNRFKQQQSMTPPQLPMTLPIAQAPVPQQAQPVMPSFLNNLSQLGQHFGQAALGAGQAYQQREAGYVQKRISEEKRIREANLANRSRPAPLQQAILDMNRFGSDVGSKLQQVPNPFEFLLPKNIIPKKATTVKKLVQETSSIANQTTTQKKKTPYKVPDEIGHAIYRFLGQPYPSLSNRFNPVTVIPYKKAR